jgi:glyoxylase-like metal-dependent hydrolase (beta-lactamase superfamily II)
MANLSILLLCSGTLLASSSADLDPNFNKKVPLKLYVLDCGTIEARDLSLLNPLIEKNTFMLLASPCYLIIHPKGTLLWDTGISQELIDQKGGIDVLGGAFNFSVSKTLTYQLSQLGMSTDDIDYLAFSHLHRDHTGNAMLFQNATWLMQQTEYAAAFGKNANNHGYNTHDYETINSENVIQLKGDHDLFDDGSITMIHTPGHSAGHQSLFVDLPNTGPIILSGDLYHFKQNREDYAIPIWNSKKETIHSFALIDDILDATGAKLWIHHDKEQFDAQRHSPDYYD